MTTSWFSSKVLHGLKNGCTIGFPTINLDPQVLAAQPPEPGVYAAWVEIDGKKYKGELYYGPGLVLSETHIVLEIYLLHFDREICNQHIRSQLQKFIRGVLNFDSFDKLKTQLDNDVLAVDNALK
jgi:riboflavin kinase/FMN adenylyltransferase